MGEMIRWNGSFQDIVDHIVEEGLLGREAAVESLSYLMENPELMEEGTEKISATEAEDRIERDAAGFSVEGSNFYINIKKTTLLLAASLVSAAALELVGVDPVTLSAAVVPTFVGIAAGAKLGFRIFEESGEKCVVRELSILHGGIATAKGIKKKIGKVCVKSYNCDYRKNGKCRCRAEDIEKICECLVSKGAAEKSGEYYRLLF